MARPLGHSFTHHAMPLMSDYLSGKVGAVTRRVEAVGRMHGHMPSGCMHRRLAGGCMHGRLAGGCMHGRLAARLEIGCH